MTQVPIQPPSEESTLPTISFLTVCMGRLHHLKQTLPQNMEDNKDYPRLEFVVLDYNSQDGMQEWILENFQDEIDSGRLRYFHFADSEYFRFSHSRNLAFRLSRGRIVCNVDADNFAGRDFAFYVAENMEPNKVLTGCRIKEDGELDVYKDEGSVGRICAYREAYHAAGGFDEMMESWGFEDLDLYERLRDLGYELQAVKERYKRPLWHDDGERMANVENKHIGRDTVYSAGTCYEHGLISIENRKNGRFRANPEGFGMGTVTAFGKKQRKIEVKKFQYRKISYCITCMNRLHHLQETLPQNIKDNLNYPNQEFVVLDYNSSEDLEGWMRSEMGEYIDSGLVKLYKTTDPSYFIKSHAMNMAFRCASGDILVNLDADNFTGAGFSSFINDRFDRREDSFLMIDLDLFPDRRDAVGRIAMRREDFHRIRGYDERMDGYGWEDLDICHRLDALGLERQYIDDRSFLNYISHGNDERVKAGKTAQKLDQLLQSKAPDEEFPSLYFLFKNQTFTLLEPTATGPKQGKWTLDGSRLILDGNGHGSFEFEKAEADTYTPLGTENSPQLEPVTGEDEIHGAIIWYHLSQNEQLMNRSRQEGTSVVNPESYGEGKVTLQLGQETILQ